MISQVEVDLKLCQDCRWHANLEVPIFCLKERGLTSSHIVCRYYTKKKKDGEENDKLVV